jgi:hypothetical protein
MLENVALSVVDDDGEVGELDDQPHSETHRELAASTSATARVDRTIGAIMVSPRVDQTAPRLNQLPRLRPIVSRNYSS